MEIGILLHFLEHDDMSVGRRHDEFLRIVGAKGTARATEEIDDDAIDDAAQREEDPEGDLRLQPPQQQADGSDDHEAEHESVVTLAVYSDSLDFLHS